MSEGNDAKYRTLPVPFFAVSVKSAKSVAAVIDY
jgi:hypothetical protein